MNDVPSPQNLSITNMQAQRLMHYIQSYRRFVWENIDPTAERNAVLRTLQTLHGKIMSRTDQHHENIMLTLLPDERFAMRIMVRGLLSQYEGHSATFTTQEHTVAVTDLTGLISFLESDLRPD